MRWFIPVFLILVTACLALMALVPTPGGSVSAETLAETLPALPTYTAAPTRAGGLAWLAMPSITARPSRTPRPTGTPAPAQAGIVDRFLEQVISADQAARSAQGTSAAYYALVTQTAAEAARQATAAADQRTQTAQAAAQQATAEAGRESTAIAWQIVGWMATADAVQSTSQAIERGTATAQAVAIIDLTITADAGRAAATAQMQATQDAYLAASLDRAARREELTNNALAVLPYGVIALALGLLVWLLALVAPVLASRLGDRQPDAAGRYPLVADRHGNVYDADRNPYPLVQLGKRPQIPVITPDLLQAVTTMRDQLVDLVTRGHPNQPRAQLPARMAEQLSAGADALPAAGQPQPTDLPEVADWSLLDTWPGGKLPLGITAGGPVQHDPEGMAAHLLYAGTTGSGKTRYGLRPLIAEVLADRWQVVIIDRSGVGFNVFSEHPNAHEVRIDAPAQAIEILERAYRELIRRLRALADAGASTWSRSTRQDPRILIVIDEFSNLADDAEPKERDELWRRARMLAAEGRKGGILLAIALQDPTYQSMDLRIRRNCTSVVFKVQDAAASRLVLNAGGAEKLEEHHFMTTAGGLSSGIAFAPEDEQIRSFINRRMAPALPDPAWLNATTPSAPVDVADEILTLAEQIREAWASGESKRAMARAAGREYAGAAANKIDQAIAWLDATTTPTQPATGAISK